MYNRYNQQLYNRPQPGQSNNQTHNQSNNQGTTRYENNSMPEQERIASDFFDNNPRLADIDPIKIKIIKEIKEKSRHKSMEELLPEVLKISQELNRRNMGFTKKESELLLDVIEESLSPADKQKFNMIKSFL